MHYAENILRRVMPFKCMDVQAGSLEIWREQQMVELAGSPAWTPSL